MTEEWQINVCMRSISAAVNAARRGEREHLEFGDKDLRWLAIELLDYREARAIVDAKGYNEAGRTLANLVQLLPDKAEKPKCQDGKCVHRARLVCRALLGICPDNKDDFMLGDHRAYDDVEVDAVPDAPPNPNGPCRTCGHWGCTVSRTRCPPSMCDKYVARTVPDETEEPRGRCGDCEHWAALAGAQLPAYLVEWDVGIGVCMDSKAMKLKTSRMHCDDFTARK